MDCLFCFLEEEMSGEKVACGIIEKLSSRLNSFYWKNEFLGVSLHILLFNALIQPKFNPNPLLYEDPLYCLTLLFQIFVQLTQPCKYIVMPPVLCSQHMSVLYWMNNSLISKINFTDFHNVSAFRKLLTFRSHISVN